MQPIAYLFFNGTCGAAMAHYAQIFASPPPEMMTADAMPPEVKAEMPGVPGHLVMHAALQIGTGWLYASDDFEGNSPAMEGCNIAVTLPDVAEATRVFDALSAGGEVRMPLEPTFFSPAFGSLTDRFGIRWMILADGPPPAA